MKFLIAIKATLIGITTMSFGAITLTFQAGSIRDSAAEVVADGTIAALVAVGAGSPFPNEEDWLGIELTQGTTVGLGSIFRIFQSNSADAPGLVSDTFNVDYADFGISSGDNFVLYWFPGITVQNSPIQAGQQFGRFHSSLPSVNSGGEIGMIFPADDGELWASAFFEDSIAPGSGIPDNTFSANFTVIPEPSSVGLALLGLFGLMARRRR